MQPKPTTRRLVPKPIATTPGTTRREIIRQRAEIREAQLRKIAEKKVNLPKHVLVNPLVLRDQRKVVFRIEGQEIVLPLNDRTANLSEVFVEKSNVGLYLYGIKPGREHIQPERRVREDFQLISKIPPNAPSPHGEEPITSLQPVQAKKPFWKFW